MALVYVELSWHTVLSVSLFLPTRMGLNYVKNYHLARPTEVDELVVTYFGFKMH